jgi:alkylation response protein AidB-like acyl-CoA dehydrogenase
LLVDALAYEATLEFTLVLTNAVVAAVATGLARAAFEEARDHTRTRIQGGKALCEHQLVQQRLFEMYAKIEASRALSREAIVGATQSSAPQLERSIAAKIFCTQSAFEVADSAVQLLGGKGLAKGCLIEKLFRDARAALIEDGSNDILALAGARRILRRAGDSDGPKDSSS